MCVCCCKCWKKCVIEVLIRGKYLEDRSEFRTSQTDEGEQKELCSEIKEMGALNISFLGSLINYGCFSNLKQE